MEGDYTPDAVRRCNACGGPEDWADRLQRLTEERDHDREAYVAWVHEWMDKAAAARAEAAGQGGVTRSSLLSNEALARGLRAHMAPDP